MTVRCFDQMYINLAGELAKRSHCVKLKVGAVVTKDTRIVSTGYNGPPEGRYNCDERWPQEGCPRSLRGGCSLSLHAEQNAILYALKNQLTLDKSTLYITLAPCLPCARIIFSVGIEKVVYQSSYALFKGLNIEEGLSFLENFGIQTICYAGS